MHHFFAYMARMKHILRWGLMRNTRQENIQEHSLQVAMVAHALAVIANTRCAQALDADRVTTLAVYHEAAEVITGDLPTPIKYFSHDIRSAYASIEQEASARLLNMLPGDLRDSYRPLLFAQDNEQDLWQLVKAADRICAYLKCIEEEKCGNGEFSRAKASIWNKLKQMKLPAVDIFLDEFMPSFSLTLDELN